MASFVFPKLDLPKPQRSNRSLSHTVVGSFSCGPLYPVLALDVLPGDDFRVKLNALIESFPMLAPAMSGYKVSFDAYFCPWSNYYGWMSNDSRLSTEQIIKRKRHTIPIGGNRSFDRIQGLTIDDVYKAQVKPSSLLNHLNVPAFYFGEIVNTGEPDDADMSFTPLQIPAERILAYLDVFRHYYANNQEDKYPQVRASSRPLNSADWLAPAFNRLSDLDRLFTEVRSLPDGVNLFEEFDSTDPAYSALFNVYHRASRTSTQVNVPLQGLCFRTYRMDLLRGILNSSVGSYRSTIDVSGDQISYDTILEAGKLFDLIQRIDVTGGRFSDWMWTRWHVKPYNDIHRPIYLGSVSESFGNVDVLAQSAGTQYNENGEVISSSGAGQQTGFAVGRINRPGEVFRLRSNQYGTFMIIMSMVPLVRYSQGFDLNMLKTTFADIYDPAFSQIGYQDVSRYELSALPRLYGFPANDDQLDSLNFYNNTVRETVAKRIAWSEYMGMLDRSVGSFAQGASLDYWAFNRVYTDNVFVPANSTVSEDAASVLAPYGQFDMSSYVLPDVWNNLFAVKNFTQENFRFRVSFDILAKRPIGNRVLPHS